MSNKHSSLPKVVIIDDSLVIRLAWKIKNQQSFSVTLIDSPEAFYSEFVSREQLLALSCIICDYNFDNSRQNGLDVAKYIKGLAPEAKVFLSTFATFDKKIDLKNIDGVISKDAVDLSNMKL